MQGIPGQDQYNVHSQKDASRAGKSATKSAGIHREQLKQIWDKIEALKVKLEKQIH